MSEYGVDHICNGAVIAYLSEISVRQTEMSQYIIVAVFSETVIHICVKILNEVLLVSAAEIECM